MEENWISVKGFEGLYDISGYGKVRSAKTGKVLKPYVVAKGYLQVTLSKKSKQTHFHIHRLVAINFIDNPDSRPEVNHKNGIKSDNRVDNLEWVTRIYNLQHAWRTGLMKNSIPVGEKHGKAILKEAEVLVIISSKEPLKSLAKKYKVKLGAIKSIRSGKTWKHLRPKPSQP